jgi:hypothetical protein
MKELYLVACGLLIGLSVRDWLERYQERIAWRAADMAAENLQHRARCARRDAELNPETPVEPAVATPA